MDRPGPAQLHEREAEVAQLAAAVADARDGRGGLVVIEGPPGIGKTRLLQAARDAARATVRADQGEVRVLSARASELEMSFPFGVIHQLLDNLVYGATEQRRARWFQGAAALAEPLFAPSQAPVAPEGGADLYPRLHGLHWLITALARDQPLVLLCDDVQWADEPSLETLCFLARRVEDLPVSLICATRPAGDERRPMLAQLVLEPSARHITPSPLSEDAVAGVVRQVLSADADPAFTRACHAATRGNPLLVGELLREAHARELEPTAAAAGELGSLAPGGIAAVVLLRLARLPKGSRELAEAVAILGDGVGSREAAALAGLDDDTAAESAISLVRAGILEDRDGLGFSHPVVRAAVYQGVPAPERVREHARAARLLRALGRGDEAIANHLLLSEGSGDPDAVGTLRKAAARAASLGSPASAVAYLQRALGEPPPDDLRTEVLLELGRAGARAGAAGAAAHLEEAIRAGETAELRAEAGLELARVLRFGGGGPAAVDVLEERLSEREHVSRELVEALDSELLGLAYISEAARARLWDRVRAQEDPGEATTAAEAFVLAGMAFDAGAAGDSLERAVELCDRANAAVTRFLPEDPTEGGYGRLILGVAYMWCDRLDDADRLFESLVSRARRHGSAVALSGAAACKSLSLYRRGALGDADEDARTALDLAHRVHGTKTLLNAAQATAPLVAIERDVPREDLAELLAGLERGVIDDDALPSHLVLYTRGILQLELGNPAAAIDELLESGRRGVAWHAPNPAILPWRADAAMAYLRLGERDAARELADEELELARRFGAPRPIALALRAQALAAADDTSIERLRAAVDLLGSAPAELDRARALVDLGAALRRAGHRNDAQDVLRRGQELAARVGSTRLGRVAHDELLATGLRPRRVALSGVESLTPAERRVARMAAAGSSNRMIAQELFVTEKTVETHLARAYAKLGVRSRTQLPDVMGTEEAVAA